MIEVEEAQARILARVAPLPAESCALADAQGRFLAADVRASRSLPPFDNSAMDGWGVRVADVVHPPSRLRIVGESRAGGELPRAIGPGEAVRIFTGAPVSPGVEAIVKQEDTAREGDDVVVRVSVPPANHFRRRGEDVSEGDVVLHAGDAVGPGEIGLLAALGVSTVAVRRRPKVAVLSTGDELVELGEALGPAQIVASNGLAIAAQARAAGADVVPLGIARDTQESIRARIEEARGADLLLSSGGVSVGDYDLVRGVLETLGWRSDFWKVRMKPGKPLAFGMLGEMAVLGLPGNPVSAMVTFTLFARPALRKALGDPSPLPTPMPATLGAPYAKDDDRKHYLRCKTEHRASAVVLHPNARQGSGMLSSMTGADALAIVDGPPGPRLPGAEILRIPL